MGICEYANVRICEWGIQFIFVESMEMGDHILYLSLGSNLGDRRGQLNGAVGDDSEDDREGEEVFFIL